jgi:hypothetical protein
LTQTFGETSHFFFANVRIERVWNNSLPVVLQIVCFFVDRVTRLQFYVFGAFFFSFLELSWWSDLRIDFHKLLLRPVLFGHSEPVRTPFSTLL